MNISPLKPKILSIKLIPQTDLQLLHSFGVKGKPGGSLGLITCDMDDALFTALDEATKDSQVEVIYAKSFYAGSAHASGPLSGEAIGIFQGEDPQNVIDALMSCKNNLEQKAWFYKTQGAVEIPFFPMVISSLGHYLSKEAGLKAGDAMAYLIAPPIESVLGIDAALKAADVKLVKHFKPPTETNFGGGYLSGDLHEVEAAARAFSEMMIKLSQNKMDL